MAIRDPEDERILFAVEHYFKGEHTAFEWLSRKVPALDGLTPREYVQVHGVEALVGHLEHALRYASGSS